MSALPPKADIRQRIEHVCFVPEADTELVRYRAKPRQKKPALPCFSLGRTQYKD
jgi:hypothetical protein